MAMWYLRCRDSKCSAGKRWYDYDSKADVLTAKQRHESIYEHKVNITRIPALYLIWVRVALAFLVVALIALAVMFVCPSVREIAGWVCLISALIATLASLTHPQKK